MHKSSVFTAILLMLVIASSCNSGGVYSEYKGLKEGWNATESVDFIFQAPDTTEAHNIFINIRNDGDYKYSNLFLIVNMDFPNNETITDTLEYEMAKPSGEWLGTGFSDIKENKLYYKENVIFPVNGEYKISVNQAMRKNGNVQGIEVLEGIIDVGISIEKAIK